MSRDELMTMLKKNYADFFNFISGLSREDFLLQMKDKWSPGQQLKHLLISVKPVRQILGLPAFLLLLVWGKANRKSRTYEELVHKYQEKLAIGGSATARFVPQPVVWEDKEKLVQKLNSEVEALINIIKGFSEEELDKIILPHPLLGKLTVREMLYFTSYHVSHHKSGITKLITERK